MSGETPRPLADGLMTIETAGGRPRLLQSRCEQCGASAFPPRNRCAACSSTVLVVEDAPEGGSVYSWTTAPGAGPPRVVALVRLPNGLVVQGFAAAQPEDMRIDAPVTLTVLPMGQDSDGRPLCTYAFALATSEVRP